MATPGTPIISPPGGSPPGGSPPPGSPPAGSPPAVDSTMSLLLRNIKANLLAINSTYLQNDSTSAYLGKYTKNGNNYVMGPDGLNLLDDLLSESDTTNIGKFIQVPGANIKISSTSFNQVSSILTPYLGELLADFITNTNSRDVTQLRDINLLYNFTSASNDFVNKVIALYAVYEILNPWNLQNYVDNKDIVITVPDVIVSTARVEYKKIQINRNKSEIISLEPAAYYPVPNTSASPPISASGVNLSNLIANIHRIIDFTRWTKDSLKKYNIYPLRRIIYSYIQLCQYKMAMKIYSGLSAADDTNGRNLVSYIGTILYITNESVNNSSEPNNVITQLSSDINKRVDIYKTSLDKITDLNRNVNTGKKELSLNQDKVNALSKIKSTMFKFELTAGIILALVLVGAAVIIVLPLEYGKKVTYAGTLLVVSIISGMLITLIYSRQGFVNYEKFTTFADLQGSVDLTVAGSANVMNANSAQRYSNYQAFREPMDLFYYGELATFIENTITLTNNLQTFNIYGEVNYSLQKEQSYYSGQNNALINSNQKINALYKTSFLDQIKIAALMNYFITINIIISASTMAYVVLLPYHYETFVMVIGFIAAVISTTIFIIEINLRVRTDGAKLYWGNPATTNL